MQKPHQKVAGLVLSVLVITSSRAIWLNLTQRSGPVSGTGAPNSGYGYPGGIQCNERIRDKFIKTAESARVPRMGPGESYTGVQGTVRTARRLLVERLRRSKDVYYRPGAVFKGTGRWCHVTSLWHVRHLPELQWRVLRHGPSNHHSCTRVAVLAPCTKTASRTSITKARGP